MRASAAPRVDDVVHEPYCGPAVDVTTGYQLEGIRTERWADYPTDEYGHRTGEVVVTTRCTECGAASYIRTAGRPQVRP